MQRFIEQDLIAWKNSSNRLPLIIRGARQVGKTYTIDKFGREHYKNVVTLNFDESSDYQQCFETLEINRIITSIELMTGENIVDQETLLFLDEIQQCPRALQSLRYFKEKRPGLHVIAAGSLLEFALRQEDFSFPVGRVEFLYMKPLSFREFLMNAGHEKLSHLLQTVTFKLPLESSIHTRLLKLTREYMLLGGMPAVVSSYIETKSFLTANRLQSLLLESYRNDFGKYASKTQFQYLQKFFEKAPLLVGQHFKYVKVDAEARSRDLKVALEQLCWTGLIDRVFQTSANGIPLQAEVNERKFKLIFLDIGLMQNANKVDPIVILNQEVWQVNEGALAEQLVGQELLAAGNVYEKTSLFFWEREERNSSAEVDYVMQVQSHIVPLEVKAGKDGRRRSLKLFMAEKKSSLGLTVSQSPLDKNEQGILNVPFYLVDQIKRIVLSS